MGARTWLVGAGSGVDALTVEPKPLDGLPADEVCPHDLGHVTKLDESIPDALRVDDHRGAVLTLVQTSGRIGADGNLQTPAGNLLLEPLPERRSPVLIAATSRVTSSTRVGTDKHMVMKGGHDVTRAEL